MMCRSASITSELIRLPSVNPLGRIEPTAECGESRVTLWLEQWANTIGLPGVRQPIEPGRDNFLVTFAPPGFRHSILLEVHQDTVPVEGMTIPPFGGEIREGRVWGRGACDVKGSMALVLATLEKLQLDPNPPPIKVVAAFTIDEEHGFLGIHRLVQEMPDVEGAIVFEPTRLNIVETHKEIVRFDIETRGRACHSSRPLEGVNAIEAMARLILKLGDYRDILSSRIDPLLGPGTLSIGVIQGGSVANIVPDRCRIEIDRRLLPNETANGAWEEVKKFMAKNLPPTLQHEVLPLAFDCPPLKKLAGVDSISKVLGSAINEVIGSHEIIGVPFGTDASALCQAGLPSIVFGPGDISQAHTKDEWIEIDQLVQAERILYRFLQQWANQNPTP